MRCIVRHLIEIEAYEGIRAVRTRRYPNTLVLIRGQGMEVGEVFVASPLTSRSLITTTLVFTWEIRGSPTQPLFDVK